VVGRREAALSEAALSEAALSEAALGEANININIYKYVLFLGHNNLNLKHDKQCVFV
jgi:hypothetical protein